MTAPDRHTLDLARAALRLQESIGQAGPDCLGEEALAAMLDGTLDPAVRSTVIGHVAGCAHCRTSVASVGRALADPDVAAAARPARRRLAWVAVPAAAAAVLLLLVLERPGGVNAPVSHRAPTTTSADQPSAVAPLGSTSRPALLRWHLVPGADLYRVTLYDDDGRALFEAELRDTVAGLPDSLRLAPGQPYFWKVDARTGWDRWSSSPVFEFSLRGNSAP